MVLVAAVAGFLFASIILLATADFTVLPAAVRDLVISATNRN
jgi:hypothetical protein